MPTAKQKGIQRVELTDGEWADIKPITLGMVKDVNEENKIESVVRAIHAWSFTGDDGQPLPINAETLENEIDIADSLLISEAIKGRLPLSVRSRWA